MSESSAIIFLVYWFFYCSLVGGVWGLEEFGVWDSGGVGVGMGVSVRDHLEKSS